ncbi:hypothetical protein OKW43_008354 [Paraburkholderia sp. WC7.3g]|uniref:hypothetical protein n=1 Tax=Paraburkholderia sp. WC7.3g TaxID=2991070 RepID=UPI003D1C42BD
MAVISGAASVLIFYLDLVSAILAIVAGQFFGAIFHLRRGRIARTRIVTGNCMLTAPGSV